MEQTNNIIYFVADTFKFFTDFDMACEEAYRSIREKFPSCEISEPVVVKWSKNEYILIAVSSSKTHRCAIQKYEVDTQIKLEKPVYKAILKMNPALYDNEDGDEELDLGTVDEWLDELFEVEED